MTKQIFTNRWFIWAIVFIIVVGVGLWCFIECENIKTTSDFFFVKKKSGNQIINIFDKSKFCPDKPDGEYGDCNDHGLESRKCENIGDCVVSCSYGCVSKQWYERMGDCEMIHKGFKCECIGGICQKPAEEKIVPFVIIKTDKSEYKTGENIKITVKNNLDTPVFYHAVDGFWRLEYFKDGKWIYSGYEKNNFQLVGKEEKEGEKCSIVQFERSMPEKLNSGSEISFLWNQRVCPFEEQVVFNVAEFLESIRYRLVFYYGLGVSEEDPFVISVIGRDMIFSEEFVIK